VTPIKAAWDALALGLTLARLWQGEGLERTRTSPSFALDVLLAYSCPETGAVLVTANARNMQRIQPAFTFEYVAPYPDRPRSCTYRSKRGGVRSRGARSRLLLSRAAPSASGKLARITPPRRAPAPSGSGPCGTPGGMGAGHPDPDPGSRRTGRFPSPAGGASGSAAPQVPARHLSGDRGSPGAARFPCPRPSRPTRNCRRAYHPLGHARG
jgi:hypothetical protein